MRQSVHSRRYARAATVAIGWMLLALPLAAQTPKSMQEVPVYPGAARDPIAEARAQAERDKWLEGKRTDPYEVAAGRADEVLSISVRVYRAAVSIDEVGAWYRQRFGASGGAEVDPLSLQPGQASPVSHDSQINGWDALIRDPGCPGESDVDPEADRAQRAEALVTRVRRPAKAGEWLTGSRWWWAVRRADRSVAELGVDLSDVGVSRDCRSYTPATTITVTVTVYRAPREPSADRPLHEPTAPDLGVPLYPGAQFAPEHSMETAEEGRNFVFLTNDPVAKVVQFYETQTGKKAMALPDGSRVIPLVGSWPEPAEAVMVMPNTMLGGAAKTVITIKKRGGGGAAL